MSPCQSKGCLNSDYVAQRRALIGEKALDPEPGDPPRGGTVYLCTADSDGMMVSYIQSNYQGFGSGIVVPGTGISLENRGHGFSLEPGHPNLIAPGKRPFHTIIPGFLTRDGEPVGPFGVMGADMQPQGHVQMMVNQLDYGMNPQTSLDAPRWRWRGGREVLIEPSAGREIIAGLEARGHNVDARRYAVAVQRQRRPGPDHPPLAAGRLHRRQRAALRRRRRGVLTRPEG